MRRRSLKREDVSEEMHINLTPLLDVVFVVLIMFIVIAPMLELDRVELAQAPAGPNKEMAAVQESSPLAIHVRSDNSIWFNSKLMQPEALTRSLKAARAQNPHRIPQLFHDKKAYFGTYQSVKNAVEAAGFEQLDVILQP
jgi:biopolymer transport protein ExbD